MKNSKKRLIFSTGCFSTAVAVSVLMDKQDDVENILFIACEKQNEEFIRLNYEFAEKIWNFTSIFTFKDMDLLKNIRFDEIYFTQILSAPLKQILTNNQNSKLIFYEEGLGSYAPISSKFIADNIFKQTKEVYTFEYFNKLKSFMFLQVKHSKINFQNFLTLAEKAKSLINRELSLYKKEKSIIFISQHFNNWNIMTRAAEVNLYAEIIKSLIDKGYSVLFKEHPRAKQFLFPEISAIINNSNFINLDFSTVYPLEIFIKLLSPAGVVSVYSTSNYTLPFMFNIPAFTFKNEFFLENINPKEDHNCFGAFISSIYLPDVSKIPIAKTYSSGQTKEILCKIFETHLHKLPKTHDNPCLLLKYYSSYSNLITKKHFLVLKKLDIKEISSKIFTKKDKDNLFIIKKTYFPFYLLKKIAEYSKFNQILRAFIRFINNPCQFTFEILVLKTLGSIF